MVFGVLWLHVAIAESPFLFFSDSLTAHRFDSFSFVFFFLLLQDTAAFAGRIERMLRLSSGVDLDEQVCAVCLSLSCSSLKQVIRISFHLLCVLC